jgi:hypothetical protein
MSRKSAQTLETIIKNLKNARNPGMDEIWKHVKSGSSYRVINYVLEPSSGETPIEKVLYTSNDKDGPKVIWTRNVEDFRNKFKKM